jgi:hypothetical protein
LSAVAERLDAEDRDKALQEALAAGRQIREEESRARALSAVAERLGAEDRDKALQEALAAARQIAEEQSRAHALSAVAKRLGAEDRDKALQEALAAARQIPNEGSRASALNEVARFVELRSVGELFRSWPALVERPEMLPTIERIAAVWGEFCRLQGADPAGVFDSWLLRLARSNRSHAMTVMQLLLPVIETIGGEAALKDMASAMVDAGRWWP